MLIGLQVGLPRGAINQSVVLNSTFNLCICHLYIIGTFVYRNCRKRFPTTCIDPKSMRADRPLHKRIGNERNVSRNDSFFKLSIILGVEASIGHPWLACDVALASFIRDIITSRTSNITRRDDRRRKTHPASSGRLEESRTHPPSHRATQNRRHTYIRKPMFTLRNENKTNRKKKINNNNN